MPRALKDFTMSSREALDRTLRLCRDLVPLRVDDTALLSALLGARVAIVADAPNLACGAAQSAVVALATQVLSLGASVDLLMPDVPLIARQPPLQGETLTAALVDFGADFVPGPSVSHGATRNRWSAVFVVGSSAWKGSQANAWRLAGSPGTGDLLPVTATAPSFVGPHPIGALAAATLGATEAFKAVISPLVIGEAVGVREQLEPTVRARRRLLDDTIAMLPLDLGRVDCISAGAITQAFVHALLRVPNLRAHLRVVEPDHLELSNLNRYPLARRSLLHLLKSAVLERFSSPMFRIDGTPTLFDEETVHSITPLAPRVVVGTDDIPSRWLVQAQRPAWMAVGATTHFLVLCSEHTPALACAQCLHPRDDGVRAVIPTISFVSYWAGLELAARILRQASGAGLRPEAQATLLGTLQPNGPHALLQYVVPRERACPRGCGRAA